MLAAVDYEGVVSAWSLDGDEQAATFFCEAPGRDLWGHPQRNELIVMDQARLPRLMKFELARRGGGAG